MFCFLFLLFLLYFQRSVNNRRQNCVKTGLALTFNGIVQVFTVDGATVHTI